nr:hypothetical protein [uncultured Methanolobus sp.]
MKLFPILLLITFLISPALASDTKIPTVSPSVRLLGDGQASVYGTAVDTTNDYNVTYGVSRVEVKVDSSNWVTATGTTTFNYTVSDLDKGNHVVGIRAIDYSLNPSEIVYLDFYIDSDYDADEDDDEDLSWYISIDDLEFLTLEDTFNVMKVEEGTDIAIAFDIQNEYDETRKIRYTITKGTYELEDDISVKADDDVSIEEWISGSYLTLGVNRFTITLEDWDTQDTVAEKSISLTVVESGTLEDDDTTGLSNDEMPDWFIEFAELNGLTITSTSADADVAKLEQQLTAQNTAITDLQLAISDLKESIDTVGTSDQGSNTDRNTDDDEEEQTFIEKNWLLLLISGGIAYWKREELGLVKGEPEQSSETMYNQQPGRLNVPVYDEELIN